MIRPYREEDAPHLALLHNAAYPERMLSKDSFHDFMASALSTGGRAWVLADPRPSGYAAISSVPGLAGVGDLFGCVAPERQRSGLGSELLAYLIEDLRHSDYWQISHYVTDIDSPAAHFLRHHHFFVEHEEWQLALPDLSQLPDPPQDQALHLRTFHKQKAVSLFCQLYNEIFAGLPWNQPFTQSEVASTLSLSRDMQFLAQGEEIIGFAWINLDGSGRGLIEPLGIKPAYQYQGYGRALLLLTLHELKKHGAKHAEIGAWRDNFAALHLYQSIGFRHQATLTYYAYNLKSNPFQ